MRVVGRMGSIMARGSWGSRMGILIWVVLWRGGTMGMVCILLQLGCSGMAPGGKARRSVL